VYISTVGLHHTLQPASKQLLVHSYTAVASLKEGTSSSHGQTFFWCGYWNALSFLISSSLCSSPFSWCVHTRAFSPSLSEFVLRNLAIAGKLPSHNQVSFPDHPEWNHYQTTLAHYITLASTLEVKGHHTHREGNIPGG